MNKIFLLLFVPLLISGCATQLIDKKGNIRNCNTIITIDNCIENAEKDGFRKLSSDYGITGLVLGEKFISGMGVYISQVIPGSPASKIPIRMDYKYYLYKVEDEIVTGKDHGYELLHKRTGESVTIVLRSLVGTERIFKIAKYKPQ